MTLLTLTAADGPPVTRADLMAQVRLDTTADADQLARLDQMIVDATDFVERASGLRLAPVDLEQRLDCWPACRWIRLEAAPVRGVDAVLYLDVNGAEQLVDQETDGAVNWAFVPTTVGGTLIFAAGFSTSPLYDFPGSLRIQFAAGFNAAAQTGDSEGDPRLRLPGPARQAVIFLAAAWFLNRDAEGLSTEAVDRLIGRIKVYR